MMGTCQNHVVKTTKAKNFILFSWRWEWATSKFCCKHREELYKAGSNQIWQRYDNDDDDEKGIYIAPYTDHEKS